MVKRWDEDEWAVERDKLAKLNAKREAQNAKRRQPVGRPRKRAATQIRQTRIQFRGKFRASGLTVKELADILHVSVRTVFRWKAGDATVPYAAMVILTTLADSGPGA